MAVKDNETPEEVVSKEELRKVDKFPKKYVMLDKYGESIHINLKKNLMQLIRHIALYREKNIEKLQTPYPYDYPIWTPRDTSIYFKVCDIDEKEFFDMMLTLNMPSDYTMKKAFIRDKAVHAIEMMILREMMISKYDKKYIDILLYYIGYSNYWQAYTVSFKFKPNKQIVEYTINAMNNKYKIKELGSVDKLIFYGAEGAMITYRDDIIEGSDYKSFMWIPDRIITKFKGYVKSMAAPIYENIKNKNALFTASIVDDEGKDLDNETATSATITYADKYVNKLLASSINEKWLYHIAINRGVSETELRATINYIRDDASIYNEILDLYRAMFYTFLVTCGRTTNEIKSKKFIVEMNSAYKRGNTTDKNIIVIKHYLHKWLIKGSSTYRNSKRPDTINKFKRAIFEYFTYSIATQ